MSQVEMQYDEFLSKIKQTMSNIDVDLLIRIMYLERKLTDVPPKVELHLEYRSNVDPLRKQNVIRAKYGFSHSGEQPWINRGGSNECVFN